MSFVNFFMAHASDFISIGTMVLSIGVLIAHMAHKDAVADKFQALEDAISTVGKPKV